LALGVEGRAAGDSGQVTRAKEDGKVLSVQANEIVIKSKRKKLDILYQNLPALMLPPV